MIEAAIRARARVNRGPAPVSSFVVGHADWETQHIRWDQGVAVVVHDWDSLSWLSEAVLAGVGSGTFANNEIPTLPPLASSAAFLEAYQRAAGRRFGADELELAWAAPVYVAAYNAMMQAAYGREPVAERAVIAQYRQRLELAGA